MKKPIETQAFVLLEDDGRETKIETRGLWTVAAPVNYSGQKISLGWLENDKLKNGAAAILAGVDENALTWLLTSPPGEELAAWLSEIQRNHGALSPETLAARFLAQLSEIGLLRVELETPEEMPGETSDAIEDQRGREAVNLTAEKLFELCSTWHMLHMEVFGEHVRAVEAMQVEHNLKAGREGGQSESARRKGIVMRERDALWQRKPKFKGKNSPTAFNLLADINGKLALAGCKPFDSAEALRKTLDRIKRG